MADDFRPGRSAGEPVEEVARGPAGLSRRTNEVHVRLLRRAVRLLAIARDARQHAVRPRRRAALHTRNHVVDRELLRVELAAAVLAAVMSTADSQLLVLTSALTEDLPFFAQFDDKKKAWISRFGVVGFALIAFLIASRDTGTILAMVGYAWGGFGAAFGPLVILSLCWRGTTKYGALAGMIVGAATIFIVKNYIKIEGEYSLYELKATVSNGETITIPSTATQITTSSVVQVVGVNNITDGTSAGVASVAYSDSARQFTVTDAGASDDDVRILFYSN